MWMDELMARVPSGASVNALDDGLGEGLERAHVAHTVPRELVARGPADGLVAFEEAGHEEFARHGGELDAAVLAVGHDLVGLVRIDDTQHGARLGRVVGEAVIVLGLELPADGEAHEGVAVGRGEIDLPLEHLLHDEAHVLGRHGGAAGEDRLETRLHERHALGEVLEEARRGEHALDVPVPYDRGRLVDDVLLVLAGHGALAHADEALHPARVEIDEVARAAAVIGEMLDREAQATRAGGADHQPVAALGEEVGTVVVAELLVIDLVVVPADALLGHAGGATGLEDVVGTPGVCLRYESLGLLLAQDLVVEVVEAHQIVEAGDLLERVPAGLLGPFEPVVAARGG